MMKGSDLLVVGCGLAGLTAALAAARRGLKVTLAASGAGTLNISGACVDVLGYLEGRPVQGDPVDSIPLLPENHPYRLIGDESLRRALDLFTEVCRAGDLEYPAPIPGSANIWIPTLLGAFKPTYLYYDSMHRDALAAAERLVLPLFPWLKDCRTDLAAQELKRQKRLKNKPLCTPTAANPFGSVRRDPTQLDLARWIDEPEGEAWLRRVLLPHAGQHNAVLLPPILGLNRHGAVLRGLKESSGALWVEMLTPPPGVGGLRIRQAFLQALNLAGVNLAENTSITGAWVEGKKCLALLSQNHSRTKIWEAKYFIIATGGFLGGGITSYPGQAREVIFNLDLGAPADPGAWSVPNIFDPQPFSRLGVAVNSRLNPLSPTREVFLENVFFAGRNLAGYDFAVEKSGGGVALASGFHAARLCGCGDEHED